MTDIRPVWLTCAEANNDLLPYLLDRWYAAPTDPAESVKDAIGTILLERPYCAPEHVVAAVLRALGMTNPTT